MLIVSLVLLSVETSDCVDDGCVGCGGWWSLHLQLILGIEFSSKGLSEKNDFSSPPHELDAMEIVLC